MFELNTLKQIIKNDKEDDYLNDLIDNAVFFFLRGSKIIESKKDYDNFYLPYGAMAFQLDGRCLVIADIEENQKGMGSNRLFVYCMSSGDHNDVVSVTIGNFNIEDKGDNLLFTLAHIVLTRIYKKLEMIKEIKDTDESDIDNDFYNFIAKDLALIITFIDYKNSYEI